MRFRDLRINDVKLEIGPNIHAKNETECSSCIGFSFLSKNLYY